MTRLLPLLLLLTACAGKVHLPPPYYRMPGHLNVITMRDVTKSCHQKPGTVTLACTLGKTPNKVIIMPDPCRMTWDHYAAILCHEQAHFLMEWIHPD